MKETNTFRIAYDPLFAHPLPEGHRFPMLKYELIPGQLMHEGTINPGALFPPDTCPDEIILLTHSPGYLQKLKTQQLTAQEQRRIGFPQSPELTLRELKITQGTIDCCRYAMQYGVSLNVAGGTHHAYADKGEGFCLLNDFAVAANYLLHHKKARQVMIIDLDVHQGNGTARIFENNPSVFTFSMHGKNNYPFHKETSDHDIPLPDGTGGIEYLDLLNQTLPALLDKVRPDIAFFLSGVDVIDTDKFGKLKLTLSDCRERDTLVFTSLKKRNIPCVVAMGGGYSADIRVIVEAHCNTFRVAKDIYRLV